MSLLRPETLRGQTILVVGISLLLFDVLGLVLYIIFSASTVTVEREEQVADRIATVTRLIEHARPVDRPYLARELSGSKFQVSIGQQPWVAAADDSGAKIAGLVSKTLGPLQHVVAADYRGEAHAPDNNQASRDVTTQRLTGLFRIHETLLVSVDLPGDNHWLNFKVSGSAWDHIFSWSAIPSLTLMALAAMLFAAWAINKPLKSLQRFARASEDMGLNILAAQPIDEDGPKEIREAARAFNQMQSRVQRLLEARNEMLGALSHDFRTPLTRLRLRVEAIPDDTQKEKAVRDLDDMEAMIRLTLAFARDEAAGINREPLDLAAVTREIVNNLDIAPGRVTVRTGNTVRARCQPVGIRRVLGNIIDNALFYANNVQITLYEEDQNAVIDIDDDGPGIDPQQRDKVFTPFYRLESSRNRETGGAGLGLSIAQTIVHAHGGGIKLLDSPMGGLRVRVVLPRG
ncbi:MAG TPA: ATP-binding protein [Gammaproteobacteria bacterium]